MLVKGIGVYCLMSLAGELYREAASKRLTCDLDYFISALSDFMMVYRKYGTCRLQGAPLRVSDPATFSMHGDFNHLNEIHYLDEKRWEMFQGILARWVFVIFLLDQSEENSNLVLLLVCYPY